MRVGLVGTGFGVKVHLPGWRKVAGVQVGALCSGHRGRAEALAAAHGIPYATDDFRALMTAQNLDLIDVATHADLHREIVLAALAAGKHVLCEKPIALTAADARELVAAAERAGVVCAVGFQHRFLPSRRRFREMVAQGYIGEPRYVAVAVTSARALDRTTPLGWWGPYSVREHGGGVLNQVLVHYIDFVRATFGELHDVSGTAAATVREKPVLPETPRSGTTLDASAQPAGMRQIDADDTVVMHATLGNGALFTLSGSWVVHNGNGPRIEAHGSEGTLILHGERLSAARAGHELREVPLPESGDGSPDMVSAFAWMAREIADAVAGNFSRGTWSHPTFTDGLRAQEIVEAVLARDRNVTKSDIEKL